MKKIALISDGWKRLVLYSWMDGILMRAKELGIEINLYQFNANGNWSYDRKHNKGEYSIFYLPELEKYDGVILDCGNMTDVEQRDRIIKRLKNIFAMNRAQMDIFAVLFILEIILLDLQ